MHAVFIAVAGSSCRLLPMNLAAKLLETSVRACTMVDKIALS